MMSRWQNGSSRIPSKGGRGRQSPPSQLPAQPDRLGSSFDAEICEALERLDLPAGVEQIGPNMRCAYTTLVQEDWIDPRELSLLDAWLADVEAAPQEETVEMAATAPASV